MTGKELKKNELEERKEEGREEREKDDDDDDVQSKVRKLFCIITLEGPCTIEINYNN